MKQILKFVYNNKAALIGVVVGVIVGYLYWANISCYWGSYPMAAECWVNCSLGGIFGGLLACLLHGDIL